MVIGKTKDLLRRFWQPTTEERYSQEWDISVFHLNRMTKDIFYDVLVCGTSAPSKISCSMLKTSAIFLSS